MADKQESTGNLKQKLEEIFDASLKLTVPDVPGVEPKITISKRKEDYQCDNVMSLWPRIKGKSTHIKSSLALGQAIVENLPTSEMVEACSVTAPGFINVTISTKWIAKSIENMLINGIETWAPTLSVKRAVVDFSSPNIAKKMHVGHLRSTIIGDTIARMLEYSNVEVLRRNHVGDWGTQFGMLIEYLFEKFPDTDLAGDISIDDLQSCYKKSKKKFDEDPVFKKKAQLAVVRIQGGDPVYCKTWAKICETSRTECAKVYQRLQIELEEKGESFYKPYIPSMIEELSDKGLVEESKGARVIKIKGLVKDSEEAPVVNNKGLVEDSEGNKKRDSNTLMLVKSDGAYTYSTTDMAALWYRLNEEKAEWIIYVTDVGQANHFETFFKAARKAGWLPENDKTYPRVEHVKFGVVNGEDGKKFKTRESKTVPLTDLLDEAMTRSKAAITKRAEEARDAKEWTPEEIDKTAEAVGYGAVKYADLKNNRSTPYTFSYNTMLEDKGETAVYLLYAHTRICSIIRESGKDIDELKKTGKLALDHVHERTLGLHLLQFAETVKEACTDLFPSVLCKYLYNLSENFNKFYLNCRVNGTAEETSRLLLCEATAIVMRKCFHLLGITPVYKM
ncbi:unnamed protein product [Eruca vesicaria subsp. sativa]|uniref:arginine--tRNA ligase n=1 Tax=Eruca vesicaria subsp. sativa TaxID=29727 RepID=A0ABC8L1U7_ERUVS|nr:unnamed protein product [Eruca vesicaria subsp. sativa]